MVSQSEVDMLRQQVADKELELKKEMAKMLIHDVAAEQAMKGETAEVPLEDQVAYLRKKLEATEEQRKKHIARVLATQAVLQDVEHLRVVLMHKQATHRTLVNKTKSPVTYSIEPKELEKQIGDLQLTLGERQNDARRQQAKTLAKEAQNTQAGHKHHDWDAESAELEKELAEKEDALRRQRARELAKEALGVSSLVKAGIHVDPNEGTPQKKKPVTREEVDALKLVLDEKETELKKELAKMLACEAVVAATTATNEKIDVDLDEHVRVLQRKLDDKEEAHKKHLAKVLATEAVFKEVQHIRTVVSHKESLLETELSMQQGAWTPQTKALGDEVKTLKTFMLETEMDARRMEARNLAKEAQAVSAPGLKRHDTEAELAKAAADLAEKEAELKRRQAKAFAVEAIKSPPVLHHVTQKAAPKKVPTMHDVGDAAFNLAEKEKVFKKHIAQLLANEAAAAYALAHPGEGNVSLEVQVDTLRKQVADAEEHQKKQLAKMLATEAVFKEMDHLRGVLHEKEIESKKQVAHALARAVTGKSAGGAMCTDALEKEASDLRGALAEVEQNVKKQQAKELASKAQAATAEGVKHHDWAAEAVSLRAQLEEKENLLKREQAKAVAQSALGGKQQNNEQAKSDSLTPDQLAASLKQDTNEVHELESVLVEQEQAFKKHMAKLLAFEAKVHSKSAAPVSLSDEVTRLQQQLDEAEEREKRHVAKLLATEAIFADLVHLRSVAEKRETDVKKQTAKALAHAAITRSPAPETLCPEALQKEVDDLRNEVTQRETDVKRVQAKEVADKITGKGDDKRDYHAETEALRAKLAEKEDQLKKRKALSIAAQIANQPK